ncbi:MAG TPA: lipoyl(octanoyl) transferase LipB [Solirubrobacteraceae bacterium]|jgi:lipoyl(octanoyl) transferase|nr:lipoyl(octanoyl) transferase LipB [Solirubrobacteraceae bacterium]
MTADELWVCQLGTVEYREALALQERVRAARQAGVIPDTLLLLEHPRVYTRGRRSAPGELPFGEDWYRERGIDVVDVDRGGKLTYHGPGQLVGYPIIKIADVIVYLRTIEQAIVATLADVGLPGARGRPEDGPDYTGVWIAERKIASIGVHVARGVTTHGFAINVDNDLEPFGWVVACGLDGVSMTSVQVESGDADRPPLLAATRASVATRFAQAFERRPTDISVEELVSATSAAALRPEASAEDRAMSAAHSAPSPPKSAAPT